MSSEYLASLAAVVLSLLFSYIPGFANWFEPLEATYKRLIILGLLVIVAGGSFGIACAGWGGMVDPSISCDQAGAVELIKAFLAALVVNQATYAISPRRK